MTRYIRKKKTVDVGSIVVLRDDREKRPWTTGFTTEVKRLNVGDYTVKGYEDKIAIEKKSGLVELLTDLSVGYRNTFIRYLKKLSKYQVKVMIVEDNFDICAINGAMKIMQRKSNGASQLTANTLYYWVAEITAGYGIPVIFAGKSVSRIVENVILGSVRKVTEL